MNEDIDSIIQSMRLADMTKVRKNLAKLTDDHRRIISKLFLKSKRKSK